MASPNSLKNFFYEEVTLIGRVLSNYQNEEDLIFRLARMLDWVYRRHTGQIGKFENETIEMLLRQPCKLHISILCLLERHFPEIKRIEYGTTKGLDQDARLIQPERILANTEARERVLRGGQR